VARDTFSRMLQEEGVEQTSRYVYIFGPMIIFDLMNDPNLKRELHDLGEYYYKATFSFTDEQTLESLSALKTKVTASEIRVMAHKRAEQFSFLQNLDSSQIFTLVSDEKPHVQSVVLTQLDPARRRVVFDLYEGESKVNLMRELCRADAIPKEYLSNVAKALHKKVLSRTDFDTEQLRSSDIILDLLEKASLQNQRELMADLVKTNPEAARAIKLKLITVEMLPYIKDGHLLEIVMGLEREDLLAFLVGAPDYIRELLLAKAPSELAQSWMEDIEQLSGIEEARYRLSEMRILGRVRNLANSGAIRLVDINERIFAEEHLEQVRRDGQQVEMALGKNFLAA
jgi:flagellar motor switch protein FliG